MVMARVQTGRVGPWWHCCGGDSCDTAQGMCWTWGVFQGADLSGSATKSCYGVVKKCPGEKHLCQGLPQISNLVPVWKLTLHFSSQLSGGTLLGVGIWVKVDGESFLNIFGALSSSILQVVNVSYLLIVIGAILLVIGFLGCYGAQKESKCLLMMVWT